MGPVAGQEAIKLLGTNGGGFFNSNSAHPYENPTPLTNFLEMLAIFLIPASRRRSRRTPSRTERRRARGWGRRLSLKRLTSVSSVASRKISLGPA